MDRSSQEEYKAIVERLKSARLSLGFTQSQVAEQLKKPQSYISKIESGERRLGILDIKKLAKVYDKDIGFFIDKN